MTEQDKKNAANKVHQYELLTAAELQLTTSIRELQDNPIYTGNASMVRKVTCISVRFAGEGEVNHYLYDSSICGFQIKDCLLPVLEAERDRVWKARNAL